MRVRRGCGCSVKDLCLKHFRGPFLAPLFPPTLDNRPDPWASMICLPCPLWLALRIRRLSILQDGLLTVAVLDSLLLSGPKCSPAEVFAPYCLRSFIHLLMCSPLLPHVSERSCGDGAPNHACPFCPAPCSVFLCTHTCMHTHTHTPNKAPPLTSELSPLPLDCGWMRIDGNINIACRGFFIIYKTPSHALCHLIFMTVGEGDVLPLCCSWGQWCWER